MTKKNMRSGLLVLLAVLLCVCACAAADGAAVPAEVIRHMERNWPDYELFDYLCIEDTPKGDYGVALLSREREKMLAVYREEGGEMKYQYRNAAAVPQGEGCSRAQYSANERAQAGKTVFLLEQLSEYAVKNVSGSRIVYYGDPLGFCVMQWDTSVDEHDAVPQSVTYHWEDGGFQMTEYRNDDVWYGPVFVSPQKLDFFRGEWEYAGTVRGEFQRDLRYASLGAMPKTLKEAREKLSFAPEIPTGGLSDLTAEKVKFTGGKKYAVYTGPGKGYERSGNGKGSVSTNDWIQVFGEENGWIMIQYDISSDHYRIGWIEAEALPKNAHVKRLDFEPVEAQVCAGTNLTDDPLNSRTALKRLYEGTEVAWLATMGEWAYVEVTDGARMRGFVPLDDLAVDLYTDPESGLGGDDAAWEDSTAIWPMPTGLTLDTVAGKRVMAHVGAYRKSENRLTLTLWERMRFSADTMEKLQVGAVLMLGSEQCVIRDLEQAQDGWWINDGDLRMSRGEDGLCDVYGPNDCGYWQSVGTAAFDVAKGAVFLDGIVPETGEPLDEPTVHTFAQFLEIQAKAGWGMAGFDSRNVWVTLNEAGEIACIERFYVPWQ